MTPRQLAALHHAAHGHTTTAIARRLHTTTDTVKADLVRIRRDLRARNTTHAVIIATQRGLIPNTNRNTLKLPPLPESARLTGTGWPHP